MGQFGKLAGGSLIGLALTIGVGGVAMAAPPTTVGTTGTRLPSTTVPSPGSSTTTPVTTPTTTPGPAASKKKPKTLTGTEIWVIVRPRHVINCAHASKQLQRVRAAVAAAAKRTDRWQIKQGKDQKIQGTNAATRTKVSSGKVKGFQKLEADGQALIRRIEAKCSLTSATA